MSSVYKFRISDAYGQRAVGARKDGEPLQRGAGILPGYALEPRDGLESLPIRGSHPKSLALCWLKARPLTPPAAFMARILESGS